MVAAVLLAVVLSAVVLMLVVVVRRTLLQRGGGTVLCSLRLEDRPGGRGWALGVARFGDDDLAWWRVLSLAPRPRRRLARRGLVVVRQRPPHGPEALAVPEGAVVLECRDGTDAVELAMSDDARTGLLAWLESSPPGAHLPRVTR